MRDAYARLFAVPRPRPGLFALLVSLLVSMLVLAGCGQNVAPGDGTFPEETAAEGTRPPRVALQPMTLRGDPSFDPDALTEAQELWFDRTWAAIGASSAEMASTAGRDNSYHLGRDAYLYNHSLLTALRVTGDLRFLDEVDRVTQAMRGDLRDGWCDGVSNRLEVGELGAISEPDGFVNFRWRGDASHRNHCRDVGSLDESLTHGHLAMVMYAYEVNRDLPSPSGVDYGERADFWYDYLRNDFEAKWRERSDEPWPAMDFLSLKYGHTYHLFNLYYHFMGKRLEAVGDPDGALYLAHAAVLTEKMFEQDYVPGERVGGFVEASGPYGESFVYPVGAPDAKSTYTDVDLQALPMTYSRYMLAALLTLRLENVEGWDDAVMTKLANGLTNFVLDTDPVTRATDTFAAGNSGDGVIAGMPPTTYRSRMTVRKYAETFLPGLAAWDASDRIETASLEVYAVVHPNPDRPASVFLPSSLLFVESARLARIGVPSNGGAAPR